MVKILDGIDLGCQSWCYRAFKGTSTIAGMLRESGLDTLEICDAHINFFDREQWKKTVEEIRAEGIKISACGICGMNTNEDAMRSLFEFGKEMGLKALGADPDKDALPLIEKLCDEYGIKIAIHNHGKYHRFGFEEQLDEYFAMSSKNIGLLLDTGWALDSKIDPIKMIHKYKDRLYGVHLKDFTFDEHGEPEETVVGTGELDVAGVLNALREVGFNGYISLEYEGDTSDPVPRITACVENVKKING